MRATCIKVVLSLSRHPFMLQSQRCRDSFEVRHSFVKYCRMDLYCSTALWGSTPWCGTSPPIARYSNCLGLSDMMPIVTCLSKISPAVGRRCRGSGRNGSSLVFQLSSEIHSVGFFEGIYAHNLNLRPS